MKTKAINRTLDILKMLRQTTEGDGDILSKLKKILKSSSKELGSDAAFCYIAVDESYFELLASVGFKGNTLPKASVRIGDGLIGKVAQHRRPLVMADASKETSHKAFIGVPLIRNSRPVGILCLQKKQAYEYSPAEMDIMETVAMVVSELMASEEMTAYKKTLIKEMGLSERDRIKGISLSRGYGLGQAVLHRRRQAVTKIFAEDKGEELLRLEDAHRRMNEDLDKKLTATKLGIGEHADILDAYKMFASDKGWHQKITDNIETGLTAEAAVERVYEDMWSRLSNTSDTYLKERINDLRDITDRLQSYLAGESAADKNIDGGDIIIVAQTMGPADLIDYDHKKIRGLIIEDGTPTMHVAIVAKALNIPVIAKTKGLFEEIKNGQLIAVDSEEGYVYLNPGDNIQKEFHAKIAEAEKLASRFRELRKLPSQTLDGIKVGLYINVGLSFDLEYLESTNCDGVGLYRTELPFMAAAAMPNINEQTAYYKELMDKAGDKKVIFRSLDVGSDKLLPYWNSFGEENPAIGWRSIRITLDRRAILRKQIRAFLQAAAGKELNVMFPMISDISEFAEAKETLMLEFEKEKKKNRPVPKKINIGLMIEVPSVIFQIDSILEIADFISIGTNDLAQFIFACDRGNSKLTERYDVLSSPFLKVMREIVGKADEHGVACSVCGEMASNPIEAMALIGLGFRHLSASGSSFGRVKSMVRSINVEEVSEYVKSLMNSPRKTLRPQLIAYAYDHGIEIY